MEVTATDVKRRREVAGLSQMGLADRAGLSLRTVERIEDGTIKSPRPSTLRVIEWACEQAELEKAA